MHDSGGEGERGGMTYIVIRRPYAHLEDEVRRVFAGREDVKVIVDRRSGERRATQQPVKVDQRRADRRRAREELVEVLIAEGSAGSRPPPQGAESGWAPEAGHPQHQRAAPVSRAAGGSAATTC